MQEFELILEEHSKSIGLVLDRLLEPIDSPEGRIVDAMRYSTLSGGKRLRSFLVKESSNLFNVGRTSIERVAAAIEMVHCYSLIHDDLPAMDNDDLRRGKPTCHIEFDYATAILAGDALLTKAFAILSDPKTHNKPEIRSNLCALVAEAAGERGMVGGQMFDLIAENYDFGINEVQRLQLMKTGMLIMASCEAGGILGGANKKAMDCLKTYSKQLGIAFQITDDLLDIYGTEDKIGKKTGKDQAQGKLTFAACLGSNEAKEKAGELVIMAIDSLGHFGKKADPLRDLARFVLYRES